MFSVIFIVYLFCTSPYAVLCKLCLHNIFICLLIFGWTIKINSQFRKNSILVLNLYDMYTEGLFPCQCWNFEMFASPFKTLNNSNLYLINNYSVNLELWDWNKNIQFINEHIYGGNIFCFLFIWNIVWIFFISPLHLKFVITLEIIQRIFFSIQSLVGFNIWVFSSLVTMLFIINVRFVTKYKIKHG